MILISLSMMMFAKGSLAAVNIQQWQTQSGAKVMYVYAPELPMLDIRISFDAGSARDGDKWGLASLTTSLQGLKTQKHDEETLTKMANDLGANIGGGVDRDMAYFSLRTLTRDSILEPALDLFSETMSQTIFDAAIFDREVKRLLVGLKQQELNPSSIIRKAFWKSLYGTHPYANPTHGTVESVKKIQLEDLKAFYQQYMVTRNASISIVGNIDRAQAEAISKQLLQGLPEGVKPAAIAKPIAITTTEHILIDFDSSQTYFRQGQIGVERGHPDYYALFLGNHLLGGSGFGSLLMEEVREKRGLVYSVGSGFSPMKQAGPWLVALSTKNKSAKEAKKIVNETIRAFMKDFDDKHFQAIKDNLIGGFPLRIDSNGKIISYIAMIGFYDLPLDYLEAFPKAIERLTKQQVLDAWQRNMDLSKMSSVMVGKPE